MRFAMGPYLYKFRSDCIENGVWNKTKEEMFHKLGFSSYRYYGYNDHYLSDDEFVIFALRYSS